MAWRAMRQDHQCRAREKQAMADEILQLSRALCLVAEASYRLRLAVAADPGVKAAAKWIDEALKLSGVTVLAPVGEPYTPAHMERIENIAQRQEAGLTGPIVAEVLVPAVLRGEALLQMGQAVISIPVAIDTKTPADADPNQVKVPEREQSSGEEQ
jgi:hypothetical protein